MAKPSTYDRAKRIADGILFGIDMGWDELPDSNSLHDYVDDNMSEEQLISAVKDACFDRLIEAWDAELGITTAQFYVYGKEAV